MADINKVLKAWERCEKCKLKPIGMSKEYLDCEYTIGLYCGQDKLVWETIKLLKELSSTLGVVQTAEGITFTATGDAQKGEERGTMLGKAYMKEQIMRRLKREGLLSEKVRDVINMIE